MIESCCEEPLGGGKVWREGVLFFVVILLRCSTSIPRFPKGLEVGLDLLKINLISYDRKRIVCFFGMC